MFSFFSVFPPGSSVVAGSVYFEGSVLFSHDVTSVRGFDAQFGWFSQFNEKTMSDIRVHSNGSILANVPVFSIGTYK